MFNSIFSKVKNIFGTDHPNSTLPSATSPDVIPKISTPQILDEEKNRVSLKTAKKTKHEVKKATTPSVQTPSPVILNQEIELALSNAKRLENDLKAKELEISQRLTSLDEKERYLIQKDRNLEKQSEEIKAKRQEIDDILRRQLEKLEQISGIDVDKAKQLILSSTERKMAPLLAKKIQEFKDQLKQNEDEISKNIIIDAIRHGVTDYVAEYTVSTISLPDEKVKGKIIGREGRNIRAFEKATGVEIELDETNDIRISSFDSYRREIARVALERLIKDGRIQPVKIEQIVAQTRSEMDKVIMNEGRRICQEVGVFNLPVELVKNIGKYKYRFSYGQNLAKHTIEATKIAVAIAHELRADINTVRLGALLHDIGKVITDQEGTHIELGVDLLRQHRLPEAVINCVAEHHQDKEFSSAESVIVYLGDAASGARPGARYEVHEEYLKRMKNIEEVANSFPGVNSVAAYQAGREVMVIVDPNRISDDEMVVLGQNIADKLEEEAKWAGQIKVTVVRELRTSATVVGSKISKNAVNLTP